MKAVVFAKGPMGAEGLKALLRTDFEVTKVYVPGTDEDPALPSAAELCREEGLPCADPGKLSDKELVDEVNSLSPDVVLNFGYSATLPGGILEIPPQGVLRLHASVLPRFRGPAPTLRAIMEDAKKTGVSLHYMTDEPYAGDIVAAEEFLIEKQDNSRTLYERQVEAAGRILDRALPLLMEGQSERNPQMPGEGDVIHEEVRPEEGRISWKKKRSWDVYNLVRALTRPGQGAFAFFMGEKMIIWRAMTDDTNFGLLHPGEIEVDEGRVLCGTSYGALRLEEIEWKGRLIEGAENIEKELSPHWREKFEVED